VTRKPRFQRTATDQALQFTARDRAILSHVATHRFLSSRQIIALVGGSPQHVLRRLQRLFHDRLLDRPRAQLRYFSEDKPQPIVYALSRAGGRMLEKPGRPRPRPDNRNVKQLYLQHTLLIADVLVAFQRACGASGRSRLITEDQLAADAATREAFRWSVTLKHSKESRRVGVVPDRVFALESPTSKERVAFFLEADRATMPLTRRSLTQSSLMRKLLAYEATWQEGVHQKRFGASRVRVLFVTTSAERARNLAEVCATLPRGRGLFLITDTATLHATADVFDVPWLCAGGGTEKLSALWTTALGEKRAA
jgi:hypothetical protein